MLMGSRISFLFVVLAVFSIAVSANGQSDKKEGSSNKSKETQQFSVADGQFHFTAPGSWKKIKPKFDFYHAEFQIPKAEGDEKNGRITFSQVGGTIDQNLQRWVGQFKLPSDAKEDAVKKMTKVVDGKKVQIIHIAGTFLDGGPMGPKTERDDYVLMGAAIETESGGNVYIKAYGPKKTMESNHKDLKALLDNMKSTDG